MLYTMQRLPQEPIVLIRVKPPLHCRKHIYTIDAELVRLTQHIDGTIYRIDDLTALSEQHFTLSDARDWFTGAVREDSLWRSNTQHIVVGQPFIKSLIHRLQFEQRRIPISFVEDVHTGLQAARQSISQHLG